MRRCEEDDQYVNPPVAASIIALCGGLVVGLAPFAYSASQIYPSAGTISTCKCSIPRASMTVHWIKGIILSTWPNPDGLFFANRYSASTPATVQTKRGCMPVNTDGRRR